MGIAALALVIHLLLPLGVAAQATDPLSVKHAFDTAMNAHDVHAAIALFADDAVLRSPGGPVYRGREEIRGFLQQLVAENYRAEVLETRQTAPDTVTSRGNIALDQFRRLGLASVEATAEVVVQDSRIVAFTISLTPAAAARVQAAQAAVAAAQSAQQPTGLPRTGAPTAPPAARYAAGLGLTCLLLLASAGRRRRDRAGSARRLGS